MGLGTDEPTKAFDVLSLVFLDSVETLSRTTTKPWKESFSACFGPVCTQNCDLSIRQLYSSTYIALTMNNRVTSNHIVLPGSSNVSILLLKRKNH